MNLEESFTRICPVPVKATANSGHIIIVSIEEAPTVGEENFKTLEPSPPFATGLRLLYIALLLAANATVVAVLCLILVVTPY